MASFVASTAAKLAMAPRGPTNDATAAVEVFFQESGSTNVTDPTFHRLWAPCVSINSTASDGMSGSGWEVAL
jgi:hypothetical protein